MDRKRSPRNLSVEADDHDRQRIDRRHKGALNTEEDGAALVEVARSACRAEQELASFKLAVERDGDNLAALQSAYVRLS